MDIQVFTVGSRPRGWAEEAVTQYQQRLPKHIKLDFKVVSPATRTRSSKSDKSIEEEGKRLLKVIPTDSYVVALDERGERWTSRELSTRLESWLGQSKSVSLLIGGADGLASTCKSRANTQWSLSALTLPHALVRVLLAEQIYRAWTLLQGHPYHRD